MKQLLLATTNNGKAGELKAMLAEAGLEIELLTLQNFPDVPEVEEDGTTFTENARKKALGYAGQTGRLTLADDSGLVVDALDGQPGVESARYAAPFPEGTKREIIDQKNIEKLLAHLKEKKLENPAARFVCHLCLAKPDKVILESEGYVGGQIIRDPRGSNGFGYDPVFFIPSKGKTAAQLEPEEKNAVSHRKAAFRSLLSKLHGLFDSSYT